MSARGAQGEPPMTAVIKGCTALLPAGDDYELTDCDIGIAGGVIAAVDRSGAMATPAGLRRISGAGRLVCPGFVNAHTHSPSNMLKGTTDGMGHVAFMWTNQADTAGRSDEEIYVSAVLGSLEMIRTGTTAAIDHYPEQNCAAAAVDPVARAYAEVGLRAAIALRVFDLPYADIDPSRTTPHGAALADTPTPDHPLRPRPAEELVGTVREVARRWHGHLGRIAVFPGPSNPIRCSDALLTGCHALAEELDLGIHTHLLETAIQRELSLERSGRTMVAHLDDLGILDARWSLAHAVWVDESDIELLAARGAIVVHNPESNAKLSVGVAPIGRMLARGVTVALGTDGSSTNDNQNMFDALSLAVLLPRITGAKDAEWVNSAAAIRMATLAGAEALNAAGRIGAIAPGMAADLVLYDLGGFDLVPLNDVVQQLVFAERGLSVETVLVNGEIVYSDRSFASADARSIVADALRMRKAQRARNAPLYRLAHRLSRPEA